MKKKPPKMPPKATGKPGSPNEAQRAILDQRSRGHAPKYERTH